MATLEKIRSKSVLLVVIIAVALLAFILGDLITNGRNLLGNDTTVAQVGKHKVDIQEYQQKQQELSQSQLFQNSDSQMISQQILNWLINQKLMEQAAEDMGYKPSASHLRYFMIENPNFTQPEMIAFIGRMQQMGMQVNDPGTAYSIIFEPEKYGLSDRQVEGLRNEWVGLEKIYMDRMGQFVFSSLVENSYRANDLDIAAMKRDYVASANVQVAKKPFNMQELEKYQVSDQEAMDAYKARKEEFRVERPTKEVSMIAHPVYPSAKDLKASTDLANKVQAELQKGQLSKETRKEGADMSRNSTSLANLKDYRLKEFLETAPVDEVVVIKNNNRGFTIGKVTARDTRVDSLDVAVITIEGDLKPAEVLAYANSGQPLDSISAKFNGKVTYNAPQMLPLYTAEGVATNLGLGDEEFEALKNSNGEFIVVAETESGSALAALKGQSAPKGFVDYELVTYEVIPSDETIEAERAKLQQYIDKNNTAVKFAENARGANYNAQTIELTADVPALPGPRGLYPDSRSAVHWAVMNGKKGQVSKIYQNRDLKEPMLYAVAIMDEYEDYAPWDSKSVKDVLTDQVRRSKAGDAMAKQYNKATVEEAAEAMQVSPAEVTSLQSTKRDAVITDNKVKGRILGSKPSNKVQVMKGDDGVYAYIITNVAEEPVGMSDDQFAGMFLQLHRPDPTGILRNHQKIENNIYKFEQGE